MTKTGPAVMLPPDDIRHDVKHYKGLMLAAVLNPESVQLLLGGPDHCTVEQAKHYGADARSRLADIKRRIEAARRI